MKRINCILLIDDNKADNEFHKIAIQKANVCNHISIVTDGEKALEYHMKSADPAQVENFPKPDIIYLDINMPRMDGFEFLEEYSKLDESIKSKLVIIMLTTSLNPDDEKRANQIKEVTGFLNKPLTTQNVLDAVEKYF